MEADKIKGLLGLCRRAGKISAGHDAAVASIKSRRARLALISSDCSDRLKKEIADECGFDGRGIPLACSGMTMEETAAAIGRKAGVITIDDDNFAERLYDLTGGNEYDEKI